MQEHIDSLTGLKNREALELSLKQAIKSEDSIGLALLDIDHFLEINEQVGYEAGDRVLQAVSAIMKEYCVEAEAFRVSGDEYAIFMPGSSLEQLFLTMEGLRKRVYESQERYRLPAGVVSDVSITIGVAQYPRDAKDEPSLMRAANAALMSAKESGRNQVSLPPNEDMIMKSCYYPATMVRRLKSLADKLKKKESVLLREALSDLLRKYDRVEE